MTSWHTQLTELLYWFLLDYMKRKCSLDKRYASTFFLSSYPDLLSFPPVVLTLTGWSWLIKLTFIRSLPSIRYCCGFCNISDPDRNTLDPISMHIQISNENTLIDNNLCLNKSSLWITKRTQIYKKYFSTGLVTHTFNFSIWKHEAREDHEFEVILAT